MSRPRATSTEADQLGATISSLKARLNELESSTAYVGSQTNTGRNLLINGAMTIAQRATSTASITTTGYYTADRWQAQITTLGTWTQSVQADAPAASGFRSSLRMLCTTNDATPASGDICLIAQNLEGQNIQHLLKGTNSCRQVVLSFWVKANVTGTYTVWLFDNDNNRSISAQYSISSSATWEQITLQFPGDIFGPFDNDNALSLSVRFVLSAGSNYTSGTLNTTWNQYVAANVAPSQANLAASTNNYWQITGVQLEVGSTPTRYDFEPQSWTLRRCLRYYYRRSAVNNGSIDYIAPGTTLSTTSALFYMPFHVPMRTAPTALEQFGTANRYFIQAATAATATGVPTFANASVNSGSFTVASTGLVAGQGAILYITNASGGYIGWNVEL